MPRSPARLAPGLPPMTAWMPWLQLGGAMTETWLAAAQVIGFRLPLMGMLSATPPASSGTELHRMFQEKPDVFGRAWEAAWWSAVAAPAHVQMAALAPLRTAARANARRLSRR